MSVVIEEMIIEHYDDVVALWRSVEGLWLSEADSRENIERYLDQNHGLSFVARENEKLIGAVLCSQDGRRGYIYHLAVDKSCREKGVGRNLVERCLDALQKKGVEKCHSFVFSSNENTLSFWKKTGWTHIAELSFITRDI